MTQKVIAYSHEEKAKINEQMKKLLESTGRNKTHKIKCDHKIVNHKSQWEFSVVPK